MLGDGLWRPAFTTMDRTQRARLAHQEDLVHAHGEDLPGDILRGITEQISDNRRDLLRPHLLDLFYAGLLGLGLKQERPEQAAPGERRDAVGTHVEAAH